MSHLVIIQIAARCKSFATDSTLMRLFASVNSPWSFKGLLFFQVIPIDQPVGVETRAGAEALIALRADVWLLPCVRPHVSF